MIGYKATDMNGCCRGFKFEVGKTYTKDTPAEEMGCCTDKVFHFCRELWAIERESNYKLSESRLFEVIAGDCVRSGDTYGTNLLTILREIVGSEKDNLCNSGNWNSGDWNSGNRNSGYFNTDIPTVRMFNKDTYLSREDIDFPSFLFFKLTQWISYDTATEEEKKEHKKEMETCGGYMKTLEYKEAFRLAWNKASKEEHKKLLTLPNWDNTIFKEISGIDAEAEIEKEE